MYVVGDFLRQISNLFEF